MEIIDLPIEIQELVEKRRTSLSDNLDGAFVWLDAPEKQFFWNEINNGFMLYIVKTKKDDLYIAGIRVHETEISFPGFVDEKWISVFDEENK